MESSVVTQRGQQHCSSGAQGARHPQNLQVFLLRPLFILMCTSTGTTMSPSDLFTHLEWTSHLQTSLCTYQFHDKSILVLCESDVRVPEQSSPPDTILFRLLVSCPVL